MLRKYFSKTKMSKPFFYFLNGPSSASFCLFLSFQTNITILTTNQCEKVLCPSSIWHQDSNPQPSEHESPPITTRPALPFLQSSILISSLRKEYKCAMAGIRTVIIWYCKRPIYRCATTPYPQDPISYKNI